MIDSLADTVTLQNGTPMPVLGLGTFKAGAGGEVEQAVQWALESGYRGIDTASAYNNEAGVGRAIRHSGLPRDEVFVTTKVWNDDQGFDNTRAAFDASLDRLQLDYVDLYLIHWPVKGKINDTWRALETVYEEKRAKAIGVSNFLQPHLRELLASAACPPMVNQIEFHPRLQQPELVEFCRRHDIRTEAWSPLMKGEVFQLDQLKHIGRRYGKSAGQVTLRWQLQRGIMTIPKSAKREHIAANAQVFDFTLTDDEMCAINALDQGRRTGPDPATFGY